MTSTRPQGKIVAFCGAKTSGKTTAASTLKNYGYNELNFADPLKVMCAREFNIGISHFYDQDKKEVEIPYYKTTPRVILQKTGVFFREIDPDFWVNKLVSFVKHEWEYFGPTNYVITDLRFPNEYEALRKLNATFIRIERPGLVLTDMHESELHFQNFEVDYEIVNEDSVEALQGTVRLVVL